MRAKRQRQNHPPAALKICADPPRCAHRPHPFGRYTHRRSACHYPGQQDRLCDAESPGAAGHRKGVARAVLWAGKYRLRYRHHPHAGSGDGLLFWHCGLVSQGCFHPVRRPDAAAEPGIHYGNAAGYSDFGRAYQPVGSSCRLGFSQHRAKDQSGAGYNSDHHRTPFGGYSSLCRPGFGFRPRADLRIGYPQGCRRSFVGEKQPHVLRYAHTYAGILPGRRNRTMPADGA